MQELPFKLNDAIERLDKLKPPSSADRHEFPIMAFNSLNFFFRLGIHATMGQLRIKSNSEKLAAAEAISGWERDLKRLRERLGLEFSHGLEEGEITFVVAIIRQKISEYDLLQQEKKPTHGPSYSSYFGDSY